MDYFTTFLTKKPQGVIDPANSIVKILSPTLAAHYGIYTFTLTNSDNSTDIVPARFSYTYTKATGTWKILEHHSSALPEVALPEEAAVSIPPPGLAMAAPGMRSWLPPCTGTIPATILVCCCLVRVWGPECSPNQLVHARSACPSSTCP